MVNSQKTLQKFIWLTLGLLLWESTVRAGLVNRQALPSLVTVMERIISGVSDGSLLWQLIQSLVFVTAGILVGLVLAFVMAALGYFSQWLSSLFDLYASILHPLPGVALLPIVILWFGIGGPAAFAVVLHAVVWSQYLSIRDGFRSVAPAYIEAAGNNGAGRLQLLIYVLVPMAMNSIILCLQVGWSRGWRALISAEMIFGAINAMGGIGWYIYERRAFMDTAGMFAGIALVVVVGILVEQLIFHRLLDRLYERE